MEKYLNDGESHEKVKKRERERERKKNAVALEVTMSARRITTTTTNPNRFGGGGGGRRRGMGGGGHIIGVSALRSRGIFAPATKTPNGTKPYFGSFFEFLRHKLTGFPPSPTFFPSC